MIPWTESIKLTAPLTGIRTEEDREQDRAMAAKLKDSYDRGVRDGERNLSQQLVQQRAEVANLQNGLFTALRQSVPNVVQECQEALIALSIEVAQKLVAGIPITSDMVEGSIKEALSELEEKTDLTILLNPADMELLDRYNSVPRDEWTQQDRIQIQASPEVTPGGCVIQTRFGTLDARRETKLALLQKSLQP
jgi:flagellar biosynthesis/type III secretory pathway protein FliH